MNHDVCTLYGDSPGLSEEARPDNIVIDSVWNGEDYDGVCFEFERGSVASL